MKHLLVTVVGIVLGAAAGLAVLYFNPLTTVPESQDTAADRTLRYELPAQTLAFIHGERALLPGVAAGGEQFWEETISRAALLALSLNDADGAPAAAASRLLQGSSDTDLLLTGVVVNDFWLLTMPGEGSLFLQVDTNLWPFLKSAFIPTWYFGQPWQGPSEYAPTVGPGPARAIVVGATGRYATLEGHAAEQYRLTTLDRDRQKVALAGELYLDLQEPAIAAED